MAKSATSETVASSDVFPSVSASQVFPSSSTPLRSSRLPSTSYFPSSTVQQSGLSPFGEGRLDQPSQVTQQYDTPFNIGTVNAPSDFRQYTAQSLAPPARGSFNPSGLPTSRLDFTSGDESDTGYTTASESVNPSGLILAPDTYSNVPLYLVTPSPAPEPQAETPAWKTSYYDQSRNVVQEPIPELNQLPSMSFADIKDLN